MVLPSRNNVSYVRKYVDVEQSKHGQPLPAARGRYSYEGHQASKAIPGRSDPR